MEIRNDEGMVLASVQLPKGWNTEAARLETYRNFCYPVKISAEFAGEKSKTLYRTGEGFSYIDGADKKDPRTLFIDYRQFEYVDEYIEGYARKLAQLSGREFQFAEKREISFDEAAGKKKVEDHAVREIKRQGTGAKVAIDQLYYDACCMIYKAEGKMVAIHTHIEAVKAGMQLKMATKLTKDTDLKSLTPLQTMDWQSNDVFVMISEEAEFEEEYEKFISFCASFKAGTVYEEKSEEIKKEISGKLFIQGKSSKKMQIKKYQEWRKTDAAEKKESDEFLKNWLLKSF